MFENRRWLIIPTKITGSINFDEIKENGTESLRISNDGKLTFVKYDILNVTSSQHFETINPETGEIIHTTIKEGIYGRPSIYSSSYIEYTHSEILEILNKPEWIKPLY